MSYRPSKVRSPSDDELGLLHDLVSLGMNVIAHYGVCVQSGVYAAMDAALWTWLHEEGPAGPSEDQVSQGLGAVLGNRLVANSAYEWVVVEDEFGQAFAVSEAAGKVFFPIDFVQKRISGQAEPTPTLFTQIYEELVGG